MSNSFSFTECKKKTYKNVFGFHQIITLYEYVLKFMFTRN